MDLQENIISALNANYEIHEHGGMLTYALMTDKVINLYEKAIENMTCSIKEYNISSVPGTQPCLEYKNFLTKVEYYYKDMVVGGERHVTANQGTAFTTTPNLHTQTPAPAAPSTPGTKSHAMQKA
eukprot:2443633-Ditylum_brightwellii.AAC.1